LTLSQNVGDSPDGPACGLSGGVHHMSQQVWWEQSGLGMQAQTQTHPLREWMNEVCFIARCLFQAGANSGTEINLMEKRSKDKFVSRDPK
jgi:hypothetical protein